MKYEIEVSAEALREDVDLRCYMEAIQMAVNRVMHSYYKHPYISARFPDNVDALGCLRARLAEYEKTGNTEMLIDCANYCLIEAILPGIPGAHFKVLDPSEAPDTVWRTE